MRLCYLIKGSSTSVHQPLFTYVCLSLFMFEYEIRNNHNINVDEQAISNDWLTEQRLMFVFCLKIKYNGSFEKYNTDWKTS